MKTRHYENHVQVVGFLHDHIPVKLVTEDGEEIGGVANCIQVPIGKIPIQRRNYGEQLRLRWRAIEPVEDDSEEEIRSALDSAYEVLD